MSSSYWRQLRLDLGLELLALPALKLQIPLPSQELVSMPKRLERYTRLLHFKDLQQEKEGKESDTLAAMRDCEQIVSSMTLLLQWYVHNDSRFDLVVSQFQEKE